MQLCFVNHCILDVQTLSVCNHSSTDKPRFSESIDLGGVIRKRAGWQLGESFMEKKSLLISGEKFERNRKNLDELFSQFGKSGECGWMKQIIARLDRRYQIQA